MKIIVEQDVIEMFDFSKKMASNIIKYTKSLYQKGTYNDYVVFKYEGVKNNPETNDYSMTIPIDHYSPYKNILGDLPAFKLVYNDNLKNKNGRFFHDGYSYRIEIASGGAIWDYKIKGDRKALFNMFDRTHSTLVHELVHFVDKIKNKAKFHPNQSSLNRSEYFLSDEEKKAFQAQAFKYVVDEIKDGLYIVLKHKPKSSVKEIRSIMDLDYKKIKSDFFGAINSISRQVGANGISNEYRKELEVLFDNFYKIYDRKIDKNIKGILDGSIRTKSDVFLENIYKQK